MGIQAHRPSEKRGKEKRSEEATWLYINLELQQMMAIQPPLKQCIFNLTGGESVLGISQPATELLS